MNDESAKGSNYKWRVVIYLAITYFLMHSTRQIFNAALPQIKIGLAGHGATDAQLGLSRTIFLFSYGLMVPFAGLAADFFRRKWVIVVGVALFSTSVFFTGYAESMLMLFVMYGLMNGIGQCMIPGPASSLIAQFHQETRSTALSIYQSALYVGVISASILGGWLGEIDPNGWRWAFWAFGAFSIVWMFVLVFCLRNTPALHETDHTMDKPKFADALKAFFSKPSAILIMFAFGMLVFGSNCFRTWMPAYLQKSGWGLTPAKAAFHGVAWYYIGSFIGIAWGARMSDRLSRHHHGVRVSVMATGMLLAAPAMALMVNMPNLALCGVMMFIFGIANGFFDCNLYAGLYDVVAPRYRAAAMGMYLCGAFLIGCPATAVLGWVGEHYSIGFGMAIFGATYALGGLALLVVRLVFFDRDKVRD